MVDPQEAKADRVVERSSAVSNVAFQRIQPVSESAQGDGGAVRPASSLSAFVAPHAFDQLGGVP
jgi:hypothetical protein